MDQTPVFFSMTPTTTLTERGLRIVKVRNLSGSTQRLTLSVAVTVAGQFLKPIIFFKGKPGVRMEKREFHTYPEKCIYAVQEKHWMSEVLCLKWVEEV